MSADRYLIEIPAPYRPIRVDPPRGFRIGHSGDLACPHRDVSCCAVCAQAHAEIVEVYGQHFWIGDPRERQALISSLNASKENRR